MIRLIFSINKEVYVIEIRGKEIYYSDRKMKQKTRMIPPDERIKLKISRNIVPKNIANQFELNYEERLEYNNAKSEEELAKICIKDAEKNGSILLKKEVI
jgi:hypothetical protein